MKSSKQWWNETKTNTTKFNKWLSQQWLAEETAFERIKELSLNGKKNEKILMRIANDEFKHAELIKNLCITRGVSKAKNSTNRYYDSVNLSELNQDELYAIGHYAEGMRLSRIQAIVDDTDTPADVLEAFKVILKDEIMHEKAFGKITSKIALNSMKNKHELGVQALGLTL